MQSPRACPPSLASTPAIGPSFTFVPLAKESPAQLLQRAANALKNAGLDAAMVLAFGELQGLALLEKSLSSTPDCKAWPLLTAEGKPTGGHSLAGLQILTCTQLKPRRLYSEGRCVGTLLEDQEARHCILAGLRPEISTKTPALQTALLFQEMEALLKTADFGLQDLIRTWFYNEDILAWYDTFNQARSKAYAPHEFKTGASPASTGIGALNTDGTALTMAAWAIQALTPVAVAKPVASPLQCPAPNYGSTFSRAMELASFGKRRLLISGTASIAQGGASLWQDDVGKQIETTMGVIEAILHARGFTLSQTERAIAYFKNGADHQHFIKWLKENNLEAMPYLAVESTVCRGELLFELELDMAE